MTTKAAEPLTGLALLRAPFPDNAISKLPKETKKQAADRKAAMDRNEWPPRCKVCDGFHHVGAVHLDYVGHAALTHRLLEADELWSWEPVAFTPQGLPAFDNVGGLWIKLTVCGVTRLGYGNAEGKIGGDAVKEIIGDALRNAAMRFGAALDLWHKGDLHADEGEPDAPKGDPKKAPQSAAATKIIQTISAAKSAEEFKAIWEGSKAAWKEFLNGEDYARVVASMKSQAIVWQTQSRPPDRVETGEVAPMADGETPFDDEIPY